MYTYNLYIYIYLTLAWAIEWKASQNFDMESQSCLIENPVGVNDLNIMGLYPVGFHIPYKQIQIKSNKYI